MRILQVASLALVGALSACSVQGVTFVDSAGLCCLVSILKALPSGGRVRLVGVQPAVKILFDLTRLERIFPMFPTVEEALAA